MWFSAWGCFVVLKKKGKARGMNRLRFECVCVCVLAIFWGGRVGESIHLFSFRGSSEEIWVASLLFCVYFSK